MVNFMGVQSFRIVEEPDLIKKLIPPTAQFEAPPSKKNRWGFPAGGQKGRGSGGRNFCPLASPPKADNGVGKRFRNSCVSRKAKQKNFRFLN